MQNSQIPDLNFSSSTGIADVTNSLNEHLTKCNKSAIIALENMVLEEHIIYKLENKPAFIGKEVTRKTFDGYTLTGHFPNAMFLKLKY